MFSWRSGLRMAVAVGLLAVGVGEAQEPPGQERPRPADGAALHDGYESGRTSWQQEYTDATVRLLAHERSDRAVHGGKLSERFVFEATAGTRFFVSEALPKVPVTEDLALSLYVRCNQSGAQVFGWVVLPEDIDPETKAPSYLMIPGTVFNRPDRWQKLELAEMLPVIEEQARVLRAASRRPVSLKGAYLARVVVNLLGGQGRTDIFLDDLQVGPVSPDLAADWEAGRSPDREGAKPGAAGRAEADRLPGTKGPARSALPPLKFERGVLSKLDSARRYTPWLPVAIDAPGANPVELRRAAFDVLVTDEAPDRRSIQTAVDRGMYLMPRLMGTTQEGGVEHALRAMADFPIPGAVLLWSLGDHLGAGREVAARRREVEAVRDVLSAIHDSSDDLRLATATVDGEFRLYARSPANLDILGFDLPIWGRAMSMSDGLQYAIQRKQLTARANPEAMFWGWIPASTPEVFTRNVWGADAVPGWGRPRVLPEQLRLMTYVALASGCRGLTFVGDADLTRPEGEALLLEMSFLNAEIDLLEDILAANTKTIADYKVYDPDPAERPATANVNQKRMPVIKEADGKPGLHTAGVPLPGHTGSLLLVADLAPDAQYQPPQMAYHDLVLRPMLPVGVHVLEISPGGARFIEQIERVPGGTQITLPDFGTTTAVLCTTDLELCERIRRHVRSIQAPAAGMAIRQAEVTLAAVREIHQRLKDDGHLINTEEDLKKRRKRGIESPPADADKLVEKVEEYIKNARNAQMNQDYNAAWIQARLAGRPLRYLMFAYYSQGMAELRKVVEESFNGPKVEYPEGQIRPYPKSPVLITPVGCPPAISFSTLPQMHIWKDWAAEPQGYRFGPNLIPSGSFDDPSAIQSAGWMDVSHQYDRVVKKFKVPRRVARKAAVPKADRPNKPRPATSKKDIRYADEEIDPNDHILHLSVTSEDPKAIDKNHPFFDFPAAAIRSPSIRVGANNLIRISVLVLRPMVSPPGKGGVIIRDSIGGEALQFRTSDPMIEFTRVVLYRKAPADGTFHVTLGLAGYGDVYFDDFRVQVIEADDGRRVEPDRGGGLVRRPRPAASTPAPALPDPRVPASTAGRIPATSRPR